MGCACKTRDDTRLETEQKQTFTILVLVQDYITVNRNKTSGLASWPIIDQQCPNGRSRYPNNHADHLFALTESQSLTEPNCDKKKNGDPDECHLRSQSEQKRSLKRNNARDNPTKQSVALNGKAPGLFQKSFISEVSVVTPRNCVLQFDAVSILYSQMDRQDNQLSVCGSRLTWLPVDGVKSDQH